ncbi:MAG: 2,5-diamino-6-(ribosylamino)-4(3H)-pyrimidinone 5'-phosphate reductase [Nitrosopumilales archaeon CG15_BIG_FIL_POST_REV_8_21_14_020_37_12]|nr:MAG: 2,5-diamino-6-(ribosylamino)-4(3H)-pyrimidinone 5'-phosphate reductase [Nitrosopumilales archaeon CG15_BIG_FIL_POST_REV_8_21_14_020_37_12]
MAKSRIRVILSAAISIDGKIATHTGDSGLSSRQDAIRLHKIRSQVDAILVGKNTVARDNPLLTVRYVKGKNPIRIILDSHGKISPTSKIIQTCSKIPTIIGVSKRISQKNLNALKKLPLEVIITGENYVNIKSLLKILEKKGIRSILVEGGGTVNWQFVVDGIFDEIMITISPFVIGGTNAVTFVEGKGFEKIAKSPKLKLKSVKRLENHLLLHYIKV